MAVPLFSAIVEDDLSAARPIDFDTPSLAKAAVVYTNAGLASDLRSCRNARRGVGKILAIFAVSIGIQPHHRI